MLIMKINILLFTIFLSCSALSAQTLNGTYKNGTDSITFSDEKVAFRITGFAGLSTVQVGEGNYEIADEFILVHTTDYSGQKTTYTTQDASSSDTCIIRIVDLNNYSVQGVLVESKNGSNKVISAKVTGSDGRIIITEYNKISKLAVSAMGYNPITFDFDPAYDYIVRIAENDIIENRTAVFKLNKTDDETISLILLTDDLERGKNLDKELSKLNKKAQRINLIEKRFTKELPFFTR